MSEIVKMNHRTYKVTSGVILGWQRGNTGEGHKVSLIDRANSVTNFKWRSPKDPIAGDQVKIVTVIEGYNAKPDQPVMILNETSGETHREVSTIRPLNLRRVMIILSAWLGISAVIAYALIRNVGTLEAQVIILITAALMVWRIAIATYQINKSEKLSSMKVEEERACAEIAMKAWQSNTESRKPRIEIAFDTKGNPVIESQK